MSDEIKLDDEQIAKVKEWVADWNEVFVSVDDLPDSLRVEESGQILTLIREGFGEVEFVWMGVTLHAVGHPEITGMASRADLIAHDGTAYPVRKGDKLYLNGDLILGESETG